MPEMVGYGERVRATAGVIAVTLLPVLAGCAATSRSEVTGVVTRFYRAYEHRDGAAACALLAPETRRSVAESADAACASALLDEPLPRPGQASSASVYGDQAQVRLDRDTVFLARFADGWKLVAVGCRPRPERPYDCDVEAG
jgi:hypothetical protein